MPTCSGACDCFEGGRQVVGVVSYGDFWGEGWVCGQEGFKEGADRVVGMVFVVCCFGVGVDVVV